MKKKLALWETALIWFYCLLVGLILMGCLRGCMELAGVVPDYEDEIEEECVATKIEKGYPEKFAKEYCWGEGKGCVEKGYVENCEVGLKCCFATIEEDKKWNYLDYDENGNKKK